MTSTPKRRTTTRRRDTPPPRTGADERAVLVGFLDYLRTSIAAKAAGVAEPDVRTPRVSSGTNLLGLIKHLTFVERATFLGERVGDWPATFHALDDESAPSILAGYRDAVTQANERIAECADLGDPIGASGKGARDPSLRWALVHLIEETGRHAGHADILRELIDGSTGR